MRYLAVLLMVLPLSGCWFFMVPIPSSMFQEGNACGGESAYVGQRLRMPDDRVAKIEKVIGRHQRCQQTKAPILVEVSYEEAK